MVCSCNYRTEDKGYHCRLCLLQERSTGYINLDDIRFKGYAFQIEMKYTSTVLGSKCKEVSVIFVNRQLGTSKMDTSIFGEAFFGVMILRWRKITGKIKPKLKRL